MGDINLDRYRWRCDRLRLYVSDLSAVLQGHLLCSRLHHHVDGLHDPPGRFLRRLLYRYNAHTPEQFFGNRYKNAQKDNQIAAGAADDDSLGDENPYYKFTL